MKSRLWTNDVTLHSNATLPLSRRQAGARQTRVRRSHDAKVPFESVAGPSIFECFVAASSSSKTLSIQNLGLGIFEGGSRGRVTSTARGKAFITPRFASEGSLSSRFGLVAVGPNVRLQKALLHTEEFTRGGQRLDGRGGIVGGCLCFTFALLPFSSRDNIPAPSRRTDWVWGAVPATSAVSEPACA